MNLNLSSDHGQGRHVHVRFALLYYKKCHSCVLNTSLSVWRLCNRLWHRGAGCEAVRGATGCWVVTMTTLITNEYNSSMSSTPKRCRFGGVFVTGGTGSFLNIYENLQCGQRRQFCVDMTATLSRWTTSEPSMRLHILTTEQLSHSTVISLSIFCLYFSLVFYHVKYFHYKYHT